MKLQLFAKRANPADPRGPWVCSDIWTNDSLESLWADAVFAMQDWDYLLVDVDGVLTSYVCVKDRWSCLKFGENPHGLAFIDAPTHSGPMERY